MVCHVVYGLAAGNGNQTTVALPTDCQIWEICSERLLSLHRMFQFPDLNFRMLLCSDRVTLY